MRPCAFSHDLTLQLRSGELCGRRRRGKISHERPTRARTTARSGRMTALIAQAGLTGRESSCSWILSCGRHHAPVRHRPQDNDPTARRDLR
jgi:hypothetical protein